MSSLPLITDPPAGFAATRNSCHVCTPLGACLVFRGIEGAIPLLHGSQGCSTYIRRYLIGHFREPVDIASSNFSEGAAVYGGGSIFRQGLENVIRQYAPALVGIATTCLSETIGDDIRLYLHEFRRDHRDRPLPELVHVSTPSYSGTHTEGFHAAVQAVVAALAAGGTPERRVNVLPGMVSPADLRYLKEVLADFGLPGILLPDYSDTLDGPSWDEYQRLPAGGTAVESLRAMGAAATFEFGAMLDPARPRRVCWRNASGFVGMASACRSAFARATPSSTCWPGVPAGRSPTSTLPSGGGWSTPTSTRTSICSAAAPWSTARRTWLSA